MRPARCDPDSGFWFHGEWIPDPYEWLENLDDPEAFNATLFRFLAA